MPSRLSAEPGITVVVAPVSTRASISSNRSPRKSPISITTLNPLTLLSPHEKALAGIYVIPFAHKALSGYGLPGHMNGQSFLACVIHNKSLGVFQRVVTGTSKRWRVYQDEIPIGLMELLKNPSCHCRTTKEFS